MLIFKKEVFKLWNLYIICLSPGKKCQSDRVYISFVDLQERSLKVAESVYRVLIMKKEDLKFRSLYVMC